MNLALLIFADFSSSLYGPSPLEQPLAGAPLLVHTLRRVARIDGLSRRCLLVRPDHEAQAALALAASGVGELFELLADDAGRRPKQGLIRAARRWNADGWRGSPLGTTYFDEYFDAVEAARVVDRFNLDAILALDGAMPLLAPELAARQLAHATDTPDAAFVFVQSPPGLAGILLCREALRRMLEVQMPVGLLLNYRPETPRADPIARSECVRLPAEIAQCAARLTGDTRRSRRQIEAAINSLGEEATAAELCAWLRNQPEHQLPPRPAEVELELTTDDPLPETRLRARGGRVPRRRLADLSAVGCLADELATDEDARLVLGGFGDPLAHPDFAAIVRRVRAAGVGALAVATPLVELTEDALAALFEPGVDVIEVLIDADSAETYRRVHNADAFDRVRANIERILAERVNRRSPTPLVLPSLTRCEATLGEMDAFYDRWVQVCGGAVVRGYRAFGGALPADGLLSLEPLVRGPCRQLNRRLTLLASGAAARCDEDAAGAEPLGDWTTQKLAAIWTGPRLVRLRQAHETGDLGNAPACSACREWFRV